MKKTWLSLMLGMSLTFASAAQAADRTVVGVGTGAVAGAVVAGPVGAVIGAVAGGFIGSNTGSAGPRSRRRARYTGRRRTVENVSSGPVARADTLRTGSVNLPERTPISEVSAAPVAATSSTQRGWSDPR